MSVVQNTKDLMDAATAEVLSLSYPYTLVFAPTGSREVTFVCKDAGVEISKFSMSLLPGCKRVVVFHGVTVDPKVRHQGIGKLLHGYRLAVAERIGAKTAMCTVLAGNSIEKKILVGYGWSCMTRVSPNIEIWTKVLRRNG